MLRTPRLAAGLACRTAGSKHRSSGFTLIELVLVILMTSALAVFALPKVVDTTLWRLRAFGDELQARHQDMLRLALQQRRPIVATITSTGVSWAYGSGPSLGTLSCPAAASPCISGNGTVTFNSGNGGATATSTGGALTVTVASGSYSQAYRIEADTGLIYPTP